MSSRFAPRPHMIGLPMINRRSLLKYSLAPLAYASGVAAEPEDQRAPHVHDRIRKEAAEAALSMRFNGSSDAECREWQKLFHSKLEELLGPYRPPQRWKTTVEDTVEFDDHKRESLILEAEGHPALPLYLLSPKGRTERRPGIVALHGHGPLGHDLVAGVDPTPELRRHMEEGKFDYGRRLVRRGYVVAVPCFTPFGRRLDDPKAYGGTDACGVSFVRMQLLGKVLMAENLRDALWAFELLARRSDTDAERIGCVGLSYGGRITMLAAAMEPRIKIAVISGALNVMQERISIRYSCGAQVIPGLLKYGDVPEIASLIAPRPALWEVGTRDSLMVKDWIAPSWKRIRKAYVALGAGDSLEMDSFDGAHRWNGDNAYPFLAALLKP